MALDISRFTPVLKTHYVSQRVADLADIGHPFLSMVRKNPQAGGDAIKQPVKFVHPGGGAASFAKAQNNKTASDFRAFSLTRKKVYQLAEIDGETIEASIGDRNAFLRAMEEIDWAFQRAGDTLEWQLYRKAGGAIGRIESGTSLAAAVISLDDHADAFNFQVGMKVAFSSANGGGTLRDSGATLTVTAIDRENGEVTVGANLNTISAIADTDFIFRDGDYDLCMSGLDDWIPSDRSGLGSAFFGVTRSTDEDRLAGIYRQANGEPLDETVQKLTASIVKHGGRPDCVLMNPETASDLQLQLGTKVTIESTQVKGRASYPFPAYEIMSAGRRLKIVSDSFAPSNKFWILQMDTWTLHSAGSAPMFLNRDGQTLRASSTADSYEARIGCYVQLGCNAPSWNGVADLS